MVDHSDIVEIPKGGCIPDIRKTYKSIKARWHPNKNASASPNFVKGEEKCRKIPNATKKKLSSSSNYRIESGRPSSLSNIDQEFDQGYSVIHQEEEDNMNGIHNFRYSHSNRMHDEEPKSPRGCMGNRGHFFTSIPSSLSRNASKRSQTPTPSSSFRSMSRRNVESMNYPSSPLSRSSSRMSSTPIMFSNSIGMVKPPAIEKALECTLEELCYGCVKKIKVTRDVLTNIGQIIQEEELLTIKVKPGWKKGTKITFQGMGNERPGSQPADITFVIAEKRHALFRRDGDDLELVVEIPLVKALTGCSLTIPLLGGDELNLTIEDIIRPGYVKILVGQGMPIPKDQGGRRGNLKVIFLINFPKNLTDEQRLEAASILEEEYKEKEST